MGRFLWVVVLSAACTTGRKPADGDSTCDPACAAGLRCCSGECLDVTSDPNNCGSCGVACTSGFCENSECLIGGNCDPTCASTERCCGESCIPLATTQADGRDHSSFSHCGGCGVECDAERASSCAEFDGVPLCTCGDLGAECATSKLCLVSEGSFRCVDFDTDPDNCGEMGHVCPGDEICLEGECSCGGGGVPCSDETLCCDGTCVDIQTDDENCGHCGTVCESNGPDCIAGQCHCGANVACDQPTGPDALGELCCDDECVTNEPTRCGECGVACDSSETCVFGTNIFTMEMKVCCGVTTPLLAICTPSLDGGLPDGFPFDVGGGPDAEADAGSEPVPDASGDAADAGTGG